MVEGFTYRIQCKDWVYFGQAVDLKSRWAVHVSELQHGNHHSKILQNVFNKYGLENFSFRQEARFEALTEDELKPLLTEAEQALVDEARQSKRKLMNIRLDCVSSQLGTKRSAETKKKISDKAKGRKPSPERLIQLREQAKVNKGRKQSEETCRKKVEARKRRAPFSEEKKAEIAAKISKANSGKKRTAEVVEKHIQRKKGTRLSEETKAKISAGGKGKHRGRLSAEHIEKATKARMAAKAKKLTYWGA